jgi:hypothetical protein
MVLDEQPTGFKNGGFLKTSQLQVWICLYLIPPNISLFILSIILQVFQKNLGVESQPQLFFFQKEWCRIFLASYCTAPCTKLNKPLVVRWGTCWAGLGRISVSPERLMPKRTLLV